MRFLADMGISLRVVHHLRERGYDAAHLTEQGLQRLPDEAVLKKALDERRVLLTCDLDFGYLVAVSRASLPSVVLFRLSDMRPVNVERHLDAVLAHYENQLIHGMFIVVNDLHIRAKKMPIGRDDTG